MTSVMPSKRNSSRSAKGSFSCGAITPWAIHARREPLTATTPQPVRRRPGSSPSIRIAFAICFARMAERGLMRKGRLRLAGVQLEFEQAGVGAQRLQQALDIVPALAAQVARVFDRL